MATPFARPARRLGGTGVEVTALGFGAATIGNLSRAVADDVAHAAVDTAWDLGVRYFDTAPHYGLGLSERRLGAALDGRPRDQYALSTKVGRLLVGNPAPVGSDLEVGGFDVPDDLTRRRDYSRDGVLRSIDASIGRLGLDRIDIVYVHDPEDYLDQAIDQAVPTLVDLRRQGVVGAIGAGMNFVAPLRRIVAECDVDVIMVAGRYTLIDRRGARLLDECLARGVSVVAAAPFNSGLLARRSPNREGNFDYAPPSSRLVSLAQSLAASCLRFGTELPHAAAQFPLRHPAVASVVAGLRDADQVTRTVGWMTESVPEQLWSALADLEATDPLW